MKDYSAYEEKELVRLSQLKDKKALEELTDRYLVIASGIAKNFFVENYEHSDLVQECMLAFSSAVATFREDKDTSFNTYCTKCIKNKLISLIRSSAKKSSEGYEIVGFGEESENIPDTTEVEEAVVSDCTYKEMTKDMAMLLSETEFRVFNLYLKGYSYKTIGEITGLTTKAVDGTIQRCRKKIKTKLQPEA